MPIDYNEFAEKIKAKYPQYKDVDNYTLASKMIEKYPQYQGQVDLKKKDLTASGSGTSSSDRLSNTTTKPTASSSSKGEIFTGYPGKEEKPYQFKDGKWYEEAPVKVYGQKAQYVQIQDPNRIGNLNKQFKKDASLSQQEEVFNNYDDEKADNQYRIKDGQWQRMTPGSKWHTIQNEGSINALNNRYGKSVGTRVVTTTTMKPAKFDDINSDFVGKTEENAIKYLTEKYGKYGFEFSEEGAFAFDQIRVKTKDGSKELLVEFDEKNPEQARKLRAFLEVNATKSYSENFDKALGALNKGDIEIKPQTGGSTFAFGTDQSSYEEESAAIKGKNLLSSEFQSQFKKLPFEEQKEIIQKKIAGGNISSNDVQSFYKSEAYKDYKKKKIAGDQQSKAKQDQIFDDYQYALATKDPAKIKEAKAKINAYYTDDIIQDNVKTYNMKLNDLEQSQKNILQDRKVYDDEVNRFNELAQSGNMTQEQFDAQKKILDNQAESLETRAQNLVMQRKEIQASQNKLNLVAGKYVAAKEKEGSFGGFVVNKVLNGVSMTFVEPFAGLEANENRYDYLSPEEKAYYKSIKYNGKNLTKDQIENLLDNQAVLKAKNQAKENIIDVLGSEGTTLEYMKSGDRGFLTQALGGVLESLPAMATGVAGRAIGFTGLAAQAYSGIEEEMLSDKDFQYTSAGDRAIIAIPYAAGMGVLESVGLQNLVKGDSFLGKVMMDVAIKSAKKVGSNATKEALERVAAKEVESLLAKGLIRITQAGVAEFETGFTQGLVLDQGLKNVYNYIQQSGLTEEQKKNLTQGEYFDTADGFKELASQTFEDGVAEMIGGHIMGSVGTLFQAVTTGNVSLYNEDDVKFLKDIATDSEFKKLYVASMKTQMLDGKITKSKAQQNLDNLNEIEAAFDMMPNGLSTADMNTSLSLITERAQLTREKAGKDPNLVAPLEARIKAINEELTKIGENAVQEQTTSEVSVQSRAAVSGEVAQGKPETGLKETAKKGQEEVDQYIADMGAEARVGNAINPVMEKMANAEYINDNEIDNAIEAIFNEVESLDKSDYSAETKAALSEKLLNIAEKLDNYEFRTKTETVATTKAGAATTTRRTSEAVQKIRAEKYFNGVQATVNGQEVTLTDNNGRVEAKMPNGEVVVLDTPTMEIAEDGFEFDDSDALVAVTVTDRLGNTARLTGDQALDFAIRDRENKLGVVEQAEFETVYQEVDKKYTKETPAAKEETQQPAEKNENQPLIDAYVKKETDFINNTTVLNQEDKQDLINELVSDPIAYAEKRAGNTEIFGETPHTDFLNSLQKQPVAQETAVVEEQTQQSKAEPSEANRFTERNAKVMAVKFPKKKGIVKAALNVIKALPGVKIYLHEDSDQYAQELAARTGETKQSIQSEDSAGSYIDGEIHIDMSKADVVTLLHEAFHHAFMTLGVKNGMFIDLAKGLRSIIKDKATIAELDKFVASYSKETAELQAEEFATQLGAILANNREELTTTKLTQFKALINRIAKKIGLGMVFSAAANRKEAADFINAITRGLTTGENLMKIEPYTGGSAVQVKDNAPMKPKYQRISKYDVDFTTDLPTKTLKEVVEKYEGRVFVIQSDATGVGYDSNGDPIYGGIGYIAIKDNVDGKIGFASVDMKTARTTISKMINRYGPNEKVAVLVMAQNPSSTVGNYYGGKYFGRGLIELQKQSKTNYKAIAQSFIDFIESKRSVVDALNKNKTHQKLIDLIKNPGKYDEVGFAQEFVKDTTFDVRREILKTLLPEKSDIRTNKSTPYIKQSLKDLGFNRMDFLNEYGDNTLFTEEMYASDEGGLLAAGFEMTLPNQDGISDFVSGIENKGIKHHLFNGKLPYSDESFLLDGLYPMNENFSQFAKPQMVFNEEKLGAEKVQELVKKRYPEDKSYEDKFTNASSKNFVPRNNRTYTHLTSANKIKFKEELLATNPEYFKEQTPDVATDVARGMGFTPERGRKQEELLEKARTEGFSKRKKQLINKELSKASGTTQVATTTGSYAKVATALKNKRITGDVLDYGAGLGLGTDAMSDVLNRNVDSFEINTERWKGRRKPTYANAEDINKKYEAVVSLNVINVVPKDIRDFIIEDIFSKLKNGGVAYVSSRGFSGDIANAKNFELGPEDKSYIIKRSQGGKTIDVFQKGFDGDELVEYVQELLGDKAIVEKDNSFGNKGVIITKIKEEGTKLAPNGNPSNLTDKQWEQVRTPAFKKWFGDWENDPENASKVVDDNGEPLVVYHGAQAMEQIEEFDPTIQSLHPRANAVKGGNWFTNNVKNAKTFGNQVYNLFLNIKNPLVVDIQKTKFTKMSELSEYIESEMRNDSSIDGIIYQNFADKILSDNYQTFESNQVKSATDNVGTFDKKSKKIKFQKAPKILGVKPTVVIVNDEQKALVDQIKLEVRAQREQKKAYKQVLADISARVTALKSKGNISVKQFDAIMKNLKRLNFDNETKVQAFIDYVSRALANADYVEKVAKAQSLSKKIKASLKNTANPFAVVAKMFTTLDSRWVQNIDDHIAVAQMILDGVKPSTARRGVLTLKEEPDLQIIAEYIDAEQTLQTKMLLDNLKARYERITGKPSASLDAETMLTELQSLNPTVDQTDIIKEQIDEKLAEYAEMLTDEDPQVIVDAINIDTDIMDWRDAVKILDALDTYFTNGSLSGIESLVATYRGIQNAKKFRFKSKPISIAMSEKLGRTRLGLFAGFSRILERKFRSTEKANMYQNVSGINDIITGANRADFEAAKKQKEYIKKFEKVKDFYSNENIYERGVIADLIRTNPGIDQYAEFERLVNILMDSKDMLLASKDDVKVKMGKTYDQVFKKLGLYDADADIESVKAKATKTNIDAVNFVVDMFAEKYDLLSDTAMGVYNIMLGQDINYTPKTYVNDKTTKSKDSDPLGGNDILGLGAYTNANFNRNEAGVLMPITRPKDIKSNGKYVDLNFDNNMFRSYRLALTDAYTATGIRQLNSFYNSKENEDIIGSERDFDIIKEALADYINTIKGKHLIDKNLLQGVDKWLNMVSTFGAVRALVGFGQAANQFASGMSNTIVNAGEYIRPSDFNAKAFDFMNRSGQPIANVGENDILISLANFDKSIERATFGKSIAEIGLDKFAKFNAKAFQMMVSNPDAIARRLAWMAYYRKYVAKNKLGPIDFNAKPNVEAAAYAQSMVDRSMDTTDARVRGEVYRSQNTATKILRSVFIPFSSFGMNQRTRMWGDLTKLITGDADLDTARSLASITAEIYVYNMIRFQMAKIIMYASMNLLGYDEEEQEELIEKMKRNMLASSWSKAIVDVVSPLALADNFVLKLSNWVMSSAGIGEPDKKEVDDYIKEENDIRKVKKLDPLNAEQEKKKREDFMKENSMQFYISDEANFGTLGIQFEKMSEAYDILAALKTGKYTDDRKQEKYFDQEGMEKLKSVALLKMGGVIAPVREFDQIANKSFKLLKDSNTMSEKKHDMLGEVKKKFGKLDPVLEKLAEKKNKISTIEAEMRYINSYKGGLKGSKEKEEYAKLLDVISRPTDEMLDMIHSGKTAQYIIDQELKK